MYAKLPRRSLEVGLSSHATIDEVSERQMRSEREGGIIFFIVSLLFPNTLQKTTWHFEVLLTDCISHQMATSLVW